MSPENTIQAELSSYISNLMRQKFGKGPASAYVTIKKPFITIYLRGFLGPMEKILINQDESQRVLETRNLLISEIRSEIIQKIWEFAKLDIGEVYTDWNLEEETGLIIGVTNEEIKDDFLIWPEDVDQKAFEKRVNQASKKAEKKPARTECYWLNDRTILVKRTEILVEIEKALIDNGYKETLKLVKRPLERDLLKQVGIESVLKRVVDDIFLDWDFERDIGYIVFIIKPH